MYTYLELLLKALVQIICSVRALGSAVISLLKRSALLYEVLDID